MTGYHTLLSGSGSNDGKLEKCFYVKFFVFVLKRRSQEESR